MIGKQQIPVSSPSDMKVPNARGEPVSPGEVSGQPLQSVNASPALNRISADWTALTDASVRSVMHAAHSQYVDSSPSPA